MRKFDEQPWGISVSAIRTTAGTHEQLKVVICKFVVLCPTVGDIGDRPQTGTPSPTTDSLEVAVKLDHLVRGATRPQMDRSMFWLISMKRSPSIDPMSAMATCAVRPLFGMSVYSTFCAVLTTGYIVRRRQIDHSDAPC